MLNHSIKPRHFKGAALNNDYSSFTNTPARDTNKSMRNSKTFKSGFINGGSPTT